MGLAERIRGWVGYADDYQEDETQEDSMAGDRAGDFARREEEPAPAVPMVLVTPRQMDDARDIAEHLNANRIVVLNLGYASIEIARRLLDFLGGAAYAKGGTLNRIAGNTYLITPYNVEFTSAEDMLSDGGVSFL